jgi:hypothetical protein
MFLEQLSPQTSINIQFDVVNHRRAGESLYNKLYRLCDSIIDLPHEPTFHFTLKTILINEVFFIRDDELLYKHYFADQHMMNDILATHSYLLRDVEIEDSGEYEILGGKEDFFAKFLTKKYNIVSNKKNIFKFTNAVINELLAILKELLIKQGHMIDSDTFIFIDDLRSKIRYCFIKDKYPYRKQNAIIGISYIYLQEKFKLHLTLFKLHSLMKDNKFHTIIPENRQEFNVEYFLNIYKYYYEGDRDDVFKKIVKVLVKNFFSKSQVRERFFINGDNFNPNFHIGYYREYSESDSRKLTFQNRQDYLIPEITRLITSDENLRSLYEPLHSIYSRQPPLMTSVRPVIDSEVTESQTRESDDMTVLDSRISYSQVDVISPEAGPAVAAGPARLNPNAAMFIPKELRGRNVEAAPFTPPEIPRMSRLATDARERIRAHIYDVTEVFPQAEAYPPEAYPPEAYPPEAYQSHQPYPYQPYPYQAYPYPPYPGTYPPRG